MNKDIDRGTRQFQDEPDGWIDHLFADEKRFDGQLMFKLASWSVAAVIAVAVAFLATQAPGNWRRDPAGDIALANQARQLQLAAKESQNEARRLAAAVETLNSDRDRLYSRVTVLEQGLDSVTGSISRSMPAPQNNSTDAATPSDKAVAASDTNAPAPQKAVPPPLPQIASVKSTPASDQALSGSEPANAVENKIQPAQFGIDIGGANSLEGLRTLWRTALKSDQTLLGSLQPLAVMKEGRDGLGMRLRLVAGPFSDAAAAAGVCAELIAAKRQCAASVYDGQRLAIDGTPTAVVRKRPKPKAVEAAPVNPLFGNR